MWVPLSYEQIKKIRHEAGKMTQWLRTLGALPEDQGSIPSTHMAAQDLSVAPVTEDRTQTHIKLKKE